jgi:hypothetical protein
MIYAVVLFLIVRINLCITKLLLFPTPPRLSWPHYYRLIYHCHHFHFRSDRSDGVILALLVGTIASPPRIKTGNSDFYHRQVNDRCDSGIGVVFPPSHEKSGRLGYVFCPLALK